MNTGNTAHTPSDALLPPAGGQPGRSRENDLTEIIRSAGFAAVAPQLRRLLESLAEAGDNVPAAMSRNVTHLQEVFVDALYEILADNDIDLTKKIMLRLNDRGVLHCAGTHPDAERLNAISAENPVLSAVFTEIAVQSAALRDIYSLHCLLRGGRENSVAYQLSLQGEMSHFHFC